MDKSSKFKNAVPTPSQKKILRNSEQPKHSSTEVRPRIQRLCTLSGIPAKNPIPHVEHTVHLPVPPLDPPKTTLIYSHTVDTARKGSWESILAAQTSQKRGTSKTTKMTVPSLHLSESSARSPLMNYHGTPHDINNQDTMSNAINFHNFDPIRTLQFLTLELKSRIKLHLPEEKNLHRIVTEIQQTIKRLSTVSTSTAIIETTSMVAGDERRILREDYHSFSGGDSVSGQFAISLNNRKKHHKNQTVQTENIDPSPSLPPPPPPPPTTTVPHFISRGDNTDSRHNLVKVIDENKQLEVSNVKLQMEVSKYHDELHILRKRQHKLESSLKSRDEQINQLQKELIDIQVLMKEQICLMHKDNIFIDYKNDAGNGDHYERTKNHKRLHNISSSTSLTNLKHSARSNQQNENDELKYNNSEFEKLFAKPQLISPGSSPPTLIPPHVSLSMDNYKAIKEKNRRYCGNINNKGGFHHEDNGDNDDDIIRSKKKLTTETLHRDETKNLKEINLNMDEIKTIFNDVKLPSPPRKFQQELPSFL